MTNYRTTKLTKDQYTEARKLNEETEKYSAIKEAVIQKGDIELVGDAVIAYERAHAKLIDYIFEIVESKMPESNMYMIDYWEADASFRSIRIMVNDPEENI